MKKIDRTGEEKTNNFGSLMRITNYRNVNDMDIYFEEYNYTKTNVNYGGFKKGAITCPYEPRTYGVGYIGEGRYNTSIDGKNTKCYKTWNGMLKRCYDPKYIQNHPTYEGCHVHESWHNFQNFAGWFEKNYYKIEGETMALDKDILIKGNKIYSPDTCIFVSQRINSLFIKRDNDRGNFPLGVTYHNENYEVRCNMDKKNKFLGCYKTPEEAFQVYKQYKERYIKEVAEEYKKKIPTKLYTAMINYEVEIDD